MTNVLPTNGGFRPCGPTTVNGNVSEGAIKTHGEIEAVISEGINRFEQDYMGRGPKKIHAYLLGNFLVVCLQGVLTAAEQQLVKSLSADKGRDLLNPYFPSSSLSFGMGFAPDPWNMGVFAINMP